MKRTSKVAEFREASDAAQPRLRPLTPPQARQRETAPFPFKPLFGLLSCFASLAIVIGWLTPAFGFLVPATILLLACVLGVIGFVLLRDGVPKERWFYAAAILSAMLLALLALGGMNQVVIDGKVYASTSREARSHNLVIELYSDLQAMSSLDALLALPAPDAKARYAQYEPAQAKLEALSAKWARRDLTSLPDPDFIDIVNLTKTASTFGAKATEIKFGLLTEPDQRAEQALVENRTTFTSSVIEAGIKLAPLAKRYHVELKTVSE